MQPNLKRHKPAGRSPTGSKPKLDKPRLRWCSEQYNKGTMARGRALGEVMRELGKEVQVDVEVMWKGGNTLGTTAQDIRNQQHNKICQMIFSFTVVMYLS